MEITAQAVNALRQKTGAGLMDCKKALAESNGDMEKAIDFLRKKGAKVAALRSEREAKEGAAIALTNASGTLGVALNLGCETDFVAKNDDFVNAARTFAQAGLDQHASTLEQLLQLPMEGVTIGDKVAEMVGKIGEKIELKKYEVVEGACVVPYIHMGNKIGVLVAFNKAKSDKLEQAGKDIAMQIAAMNPVAIDKDGVSQEVVDREMEIAKEKMRAEGKPENMLDKIAQGAVQKFFKESTLLNQQFVKDNNKTVADVLREIDKDLKVTRFVRLTLN